MIYVPIENKCNFCKQVFCCPECRQKHEEKSHELEIEAWYKAEIIKRACYLCNNQKLPLKDISPEIMQHISEIHLPLQCNKCSRIFDTVEDLKEVGKCCKPVSKSPEVAAPLPDILEEKSSENLTPQKVDEKPLTPLTQMNLRWRRKSREFGKIELQNIDPNRGAVVRQTSTPMQPTTTNANFTDSSSYSSSSIQISSINYASSCSSSDEYSPTVPVPKNKAVPVTSPKQSAANRSRLKLPVQATPLRQVMSKSIQRAIAEHGHYRVAPYTIQQRKMSFNSTNSSGENTLSFMKLPGGIDSSPLDLRLSPALRRVSEKSTEDKPLEVHQYQPEPGDLINFDSNVGIHVKNHIEFEQIELIIRRGEIKSDNSALASFKSVISETERSGSMPELHLTPKMIGNNFMKKTISFETPEIENTPRFISMPSGEDDDDVFYTPRSSPVRSPMTRRASADTIIPIDDGGGYEEDCHGSKSRNIWNFVSVLGETLTDNLKFKFKRPELFKRAADYFAKRSSVPDEFPNKRRRTSSSSSNDLNGGPQSPPAVKRQKIQARKPIGRCRHMSIN